MNEKILVILVHGIGESNGGVLRTLQKYLHPSLYEIVALPYRADYGPVPGLVGLPFEQTLVDGRSLLLDWCRRVHRTRAKVLVGYSAGAQIVGDVAAELARTGESVGVLGAAILSDPSMPKGLAPAGKYGIRGARSVGPRIRTKWWFDPRDVIPCCTPAPKSMMRIIADRTPEISLAGPRAWTSTLARLKTRKLQAYLFPWNQPADIKMQIEVAINEADGYVRRGDHTSYHIRRLANGRTHIEDMAFWIKGLPR